MNKFIKICRFKQVFSKTRQWHIPEIMSCCKFIQAVIRKFDADFGLCLCSCRFPYFAICSSRNNRSQDGYFGDTDSPYRYNIVSTGNLINNSLSCISSHTFLTFKMFRPKLYFLQTERKFQKPSNIKWNKLLIDFPF